MSAHTPGPWSHLPISSKSTDLGVYTENGSLICRVQRSGSSVSLDRREADAALLAVAPELLAALQSLVAHLDRGAYAGVMMPDAHTMRAARTAIAKATKP